VGVHTEIHDQFLTTHNGKSAWLMNVFVCIVREIDHDDVVSSGCFADEFPDKNSCRWTKQALLTFDAAIEVYIVEVIAESHHYKQQHISCWFSICLRLWQGMVVGYSWNCWPCAWP
jgi:hypothetical protein